MKANKKSFLKFAMALTASLLFVMPLAFASSSATGLIGQLKPNTGAIGNGGGSLIKDILGIIQFVGVAIALGMLIIIGIQYVTASAEMKGKIKDTAIGYLFGAICIFASVGILTGVANLVEVLNKA